MRLWPRCPRSTAPEAGRVGVARARVRRSVRSLALALAVALSALLAAVAPQPAVADYYCEEFPDLYATGLTVTPGTELYVDWDIASIQVGLNRGLCPGDYGVIASGDTVYYEFHATEPHPTTDGVGASVQLEPYEKKTVVVNINGVSSIVDLEHRGWEGTVSLEADPLEIGGSVFSSTLDIDVTRPVEEPFILSLYTADGERIWRNPTPNEGDTSFHHVVAPPPGTSEVYWAFVAQDAPEHEFPTDDVKAVDFASITNTDQAPPPPATDFNPTLSASQHALRPGETATLTATVDLSLTGSGYTLDIVDADTDAVLARCAANWTCETEIPIEWSEQEDPQQHNSYARILSTDGTTETERSAITTLFVAPAEFDVQLSASDHALQIPETTTLTATSAIDVTGTNYVIAIVDADTGQQVGFGCATGTTCSSDVSAGWEDNLEVTERRYEAVVKSDLYTHEADRSDPETVHVVPTVFEPTIEAYLIEWMGLRYFGLQAESDLSVSGSGYYLTIQKTDGTVITSCGSGTTCETPAEVPAGDYRAVVEDFSGNEFGNSHTLRIPNPAPAADVEDQSLGGYDVAAVGAMYANASEICDSIVVAPAAVKTNVLVPETSTSDQQEACDAAVLAGASNGAVVAAAAGAAGAVSAYEVTNWLFADGIDGTQGTVSLDPPGPTIVDPREIPGVPEEVRREYLLAAARTIKANATAELSWPQARAVSSTCIHLLARAGQSGEKCRTRPIYSPGVEYPAATSHTADAIFEHPPWVELNYEPPRGPQKWYDQSDFTPDMWLTGLPNPCVNRGALDCDEWPWRATQQGSDPRVGPIRLPQPSLRPMNPLDNRSSGSRYQSFLARCGRYQAYNSGGPANAPFLVVPAPYPLKSFEVCN